MIQTITFHLIKLNFKQKVKQTSAISNMMNTYIINAKREFFAKMKRNIDEGKGIITRRIGFAYGGRISQDHYQRHQQAFLE